MIGCFFLRDVLPELRTLNGITILSIATCERGRAEERRFEHIFHFFLSIVYRTISKYELYWNEQGRNNSGLSILHRVRSNHGVRIRLPPKGKRRTPVWNTLNLLATSTGTGRCLL